ncbi:MAG: FAD-dependent oxidoreductase [Clostridiaceae bacterium BRH_c20a]|nr:MAG: FAD-dependent oxidoreductase [Clostridiaceae bacterium BRH_c20a]
MNKTTDIIVIGGGVIGSACAYYLAKEGQKVILIEKNDLASGASGACDQDIILQSKNPGVHLELALASAKMYTDLALELDYDIEYENYGGMILIETPDELEIMEEFVARQKALGLEVSILDYKEALKLQRDLAPHILGSTYSPQDAHVNPIRLNLGFALGAQRYGAEILLATEVTDILVKNDRIEGVNTSKGIIYAPVVINAAGAWAPLIAKMVGQELPIEPRRGQIVVTEAVPPLVMGDVLSAQYIAAKYNPELTQNETSLAKKLGVGLSLSQTKKGNILIGATREFVGYDTRNTREGIREVLKNAVRLIPALKDINIIRTIAGLRPYTPDGLPLLGPIVQPEGFYLASGHEGDGIALAPLTGKIISQLIIDGKSPIDINALSPHRFSLNCAAK